EPALRWGQPQQQVSPTPFGPAALEPTTTPEPPQTPTVTVTPSGGTLPMPGIGAQVGDATARALALPTPSPLGPLLGGSGGLADTVSTALQGAPGELGVAILDLNGNVVFGMNENQAYSLASVAKI